MTAHPAGRHPTTGVRQVSGPRRAAEGCLLALDAGTGSCRAVLFDLTGRQIALAQREWSHPAADGAAGAQDFDTTRNWALICACIREVLRVVADPAAVLAVGCSSMGGGLVLYGRNGRELWACANGDARAAAEAEVLLASGTAAELYQLGGGWISLSAAPRLDWVRQHRPALWASCTRLSMIADWMVYRLTGTLVTEASIGSTSGLFEVSTRRWSPTIMDLCGLRPALFPEVVAAGTVAGPVSAEASSQTGLALSTLVVPGGVDTALSLMGAGHVDAGHAGPDHSGSGRLAVTGGSFWKQTAVATTAIIEPAGRLRTICHVRPGQWLVEGIGFYAGFALRWLRDSAGRPPSPGRPSLGGASPDDPSPGRPAPGRDSYAALERLAAAVPPGSRGLLAELADVGAWTWARWQPPFGPDRAGPGPPCDMGAHVRAIQEAAAYSARRSAEVLTETLGRGFQEMVLTGGAARSTLWPQILADVLGLPVLVPDISEATAAGAAIMAGLAVGAALDDAGRRPAGPASWVADPVPGRQDTYDVLYRQWIRRRPASRRPPEAGGMHGS